MKKSASILSRVLCALMLCAGLIVTGCYDDSALQEQINSVNEQLKDHESRLKELERLTAQQNANISSLQTIVTALQDKDYVTSVAPINDGDMVVGYSITFSKSGAVTIYNGKDGTDGINGVSPLISVRQDSDGIYYWTLNGEWLTDSTGNKVRASAQDGADGNPGAQGAAGITPKLKIVDGYWYVSYDGGKTWEDEPLGQATGDKGYTMFSEVTYDENNVYITMADGEKLTLPRCVTEDNNGMVGPATFSIEKVTATTAAFKGYIDLPREELAFCNVILYYSQEEPFHIDDAIAESYHEFDVNNVLEFGLGHLTYNTEYHYCLSVEYRGQKYFSENVMSFKTSDISIEVVVDESSITYSSASISGNVTGVSDEDIEAAEIEILYSSDYNAISEDMWSCKRVQIDTLEDGGLFSCQLLLAPNIKYYYRYRFMKWTPSSGGHAGGNYVYGDIKEFIMPKNPNALESANCYIVSKGGEYKFSTVKGNSNESVGAVASAEVLWETFGTDVTPNVGDLIKSVSYKDGEVTFQTADTFKEGNAVIAAKDASGTILWSWHVWLTDEPQGQEYYNNAGTMMDRNLGATSATPGDVGALGLLYQWGRKDPFLGSSSISASVEAKSTITWPSPVSSDQNTGTIEYATANPTTFITYGRNYDWYYTGSIDVDITRWTESDKSKSIYDPCPAGWRVPDGGGDDGIWSSALGSSSYFSDPLLYDSTNEGMNFSGKFGSDQTIWYPASGYCLFWELLGSLSSVGSSGNYWSAGGAYGMDFNNDGNVDPSGGHFGAYGCSVRCTR